MKFDPSSAFDPDTIIDTEFDSSSAFDPDSIVEEPPRRKSNWEDPDMSLGKAVKYNLLETEAAANLILGTPGEVGGALYKGYSDLANTILGSEKPAVETQKAFDKFAETPLGKAILNPLTTLIGNEEEVKGTLIHGIFNKLGETIQGQAEKIEDENTRAGLIHGLELALSVVGYKGAKGDLKLPKDPFKEPPPAMSDILNDYDSYKANQPKPQLTKQDELPFTNEITDSPRAPVSALPEDYYQPELKFQDDLPFTNEAIAQPPKFSPLVDQPSPTKQDELNLANRRQPDRQPDLFEPEAHEALLQKEATSIDSSIEKYKFSPKVQEALDLAEIKLGKDGRPLASSPERVIQQLRQQPKQDFLNLQLPKQNKQVNQDIAKTVDDIIEEAPLEPALQKKPIEDLSNDLTKEEWTKEFLRRHPERDLEAADFAFQRLQPEKAYEISLGKAADDFFKIGFGTFFTRLGNISESLLQKSIKYEQTLLQRPHELYNKIDTIFDEISNFPKKLQDDLELAFKKRDMDAIYKAFAYAGKPNLFKVFEDTILKTIKDLGKEAGPGEAGVLKGLKEDFFLPLMVKDYNGLLKAMGRDADIPKVERALKDAEVAAYQKGQRFGEIERTQVLNKFVRGYPKPDSHKASYRKERKFDDIPDELLPFYYPTRDTLHMYIKNIVEDIETFKFLGRNNIKKGEDGNISLNDSIGAHIDTLLKEKNIHPDKVTELRDLYTARFIGGNRSPHKAVQTLKNIASGTQLSGFASTAIQMGDFIPMSMLSQPEMINGIKGALKATVYRLQGRTRINPVEMGLVDHFMNTEIQRYVGKGIGDKFANVSAALADAALKINFFKHADIGMKSLGLNTYLYGAEYQLATPKGRRLFSDDWKGRYGKELPQLMKELKEGKVTPLTVNYAFSQLAKTQAISKGNWTIWSLNHPNSRIFTTLKTFAINQLQMFQSEGIRKIEKGNVKDGVKSLAKVATALVLAGASATEITNYLRGREDSSDKLHKAGLAMLKTIGLQERTVEKAKQGRVGQAFKEYVAPPLEMFDRPLAAALEDLRGEESDKSYVDLLPYGREVRAHWLGGKEQWEEQQKKNQRAEQREARRN
ncbi:MAG: hypothetical protein DDT42_01486 [candidate division WS2 bacterium]|uniref:Uncharacterized protein n=1 Tax=Psychracetigena formicireducens TaxID=2986056 RepID=A0A9E2BHF0_PSYF1|nr:hypothetical protein [Candidatus Psychracetigena formicireducens]